MEVTKEINKKRNQDDQNKSPEEDKNDMIIIPAFDISTKKVGFGNSTGQVTTIVYEIKYNPDHSSLLKILMCRSSSIGQVTTIDFEIKCHPDHASLLKIPLCRSSVPDDTLPSNDDIRFIPYGLTQETDENTVKQKIIKHNNYINRITIISIFNINPDVMLNGLGQTIVDIPSVIVLDKWLVITTKILK